MTLMTVMTMIRRGSLKGRRSLASRPYPCGSSAQALRPVQDEAHQLLRTPSRRTSGSVRLRYSPQQHESQTSHGELVLRPRSRGFAYYLHPAPCNPAGGGAHGAARKEIQLDPPHDLHV